MDIQLFHLKTPLEDQMGLILCYRVTGYRSCYVIIFTSDFFIYQKI